MSGPGVQIQYPTLAALSIRIPLESAKWTIYPSPSETWQDFVVGFPLELHPFAWDYLVIASDATAVEVKPHYSKSTFDTFWVDTTGEITCQAYGGLFPFTLGHQPDLLDGLRKTVEVLPPRVADPDAARSLEEIAERLGKLVQALRTFGPTSLQRERYQQQLERVRMTLRGRISERVWRTKARL